MKQELKKQNIISFLLAPHLSDEIGFFFYLLKVCQNCSTLKLRHFFSKILTHRYEIWKIECVKI